MNQRQRALGALMAYLGNQPDKWVVAFVRRTIRESIDLDGPDRRFPGPPLAPAPFPARRFEDVCRAQGPPAPIIESMDRCCDAAEAAAK